MTTTANAIEDDYRSTGLGERIIAALEDAGIDTDALTPEILAPADQIHGGGLRVTAEQLAMIEIGPDTRMLDIGCGIGGPARYVATEFGCRVTGIDLTADYIDAARLLTGKMGLTERAEFQRGDATELPFDDAAFDVVLCQNVAMNIEDRAGFYAGVRRVLLPAGVFTFTELCQGPGGAPDYPLPWARDPSYSFLVTPEALGTLLEDAGFRITQWLDTSRNRVAADRKRLDAAAAKAPPAGPLSMHLVRGEDYHERQANSSKAVIDGRLINLTVVTERTD